MRLLGGRGLTSILCHWRQALKASKNKKKIRKCFSKIESTSFLPLMGLASTRCDASQEIKMMKEAAAVNHNFDLQGQLTIILLHMDFILTPKWQMNPPKELLNLNRPLSSPVFFSVTSSKFSFFFF